MRSCTINRTLNVINHIELNKYSIPAYPGNKIYKLQIENCSDDEALTPIAEILASPSDPQNPYCFGLRNISNEVWRCITSTGAQKNLEPNGVMPVKAGITVNTAKGTFKII